MRYLAATFLASAALDWPAWLMDRAGVALLGIACLALALPPRPRRIRRAAPIAVPPKIVALEDELDEPASVLADRLSAYGAGVAVR